MKLGIEGMGERKEKPPVARSGVDGSTRNAEKDDLQVNVGD